MLIVKIGFNEHKSVRRGSTDTLTMMVLLIFIAIVNAIDPQCSRYCENKLAEISLVGPSGCDCSQLHILHTRNIANNSFFSNDLRFNSQPKSAYSEDQQIYKYNAHNENHYNRSSPPRNDTRFKTRHRKSVINDALPKNLVRVIIQRPINQHDDNFEIEYYKNIIKSVTECIALHQIQYSRSCANYKQNPLGPALVTHFENLTENELQNEIEQKCQTATAVVVNSINDMKETLFKNQANIINVEYRKDFQIKDSKEKDFITTTHEIFDPNNYIWTNQKQSDIINNDNNKIKSDSTVETYLRSLYEILSNYHPKLGEYNISTNSSNTESQEMKLPLETGLHLHSYNTLLNNAMKDSKEIPSVEDSTLKIETSTSKILTENNDNPSNSYLNRTKILNDINYTTFSQSDDSKKTNISHSKYVNNSRHTDRIPVSTLMGPFKIASGNLVLGEINVTTSLPNNIFEDLSYYTNSTIINSKANVSEPLNKFGLPKSILKTLLNNHYQAPNAIIFKNVSIQNDKDDKKGSLSKAIHYDSRRVIMNKVGNIPIISLMTREFPNGTILSLNNSRDDELNKDFGKIKKYSTDIVRDRKEDVKDYVSEILYKFTIHKVQPKTLADNNYDSRNESLPIEKRLKEANGRLYFLYDKEKIPAHFVQASDGKLDIGLDVFGLCNVQNENEGNTSILLKLLCGCIRSKKCAAKMNK